MTIRASSGRFCTVGKAAQGAKLLLMTSNETVDHDELLTPEAAASALGRSIGWVWRQAKAGRLHPVRVVGRTRFLRAEVVALGRPVTTTP